MPPRLIPIFLYHSVPARDEHPGDAYAVEQPLFDRQVEALASLDRTSLTIAEVAACLRDEASVPERPIAITFDDGYANNLVAIERLLDVGLGASVFMTTGWLGRPGMLTTRDLSELGSWNSSVEIGAHSVSHPHLDELRLERAAAEITASKTTVEDALQAPIASFAYPHGAFDRRVRREVQRAGFRAAAGVKNAASHTDDDPFAIARWTVTSGTRPQRILEVASGMNVPRAWQRERLRTAGFRAYRRAKRRVGRT